MNFGLLKEEAQCLAYPRTLISAQQELLSWHHHLYHLPFVRLFQLAKWWILPKSILACEDKPPLCIACQFGQAHHCPWCRKGEASGSICKPNEVQPGDGTSVHQIVSAQPGLTPHRWQFFLPVTGSGTRHFFCDHVSNFAYSTWCVILLLRKLFRQNMPTRNS